MTSQTQQPAPASTPPAYTLPGPSILLEGPTGSGKTHCLTTLIECGIKPFILFTEPGMRTISQYECPQLHYKYIPPARTSWENLLDNAKKINTLDLKSLSSLTDINKRKHTQFLEVINACNNFICDRCGEQFGDVMNWTTDRAFCLDSLSGLNIMAMEMVVGTKPVKSMSDWGIAMDNLERLINTLSSSTLCTFVLTSHLEREVDEVLGGVKLMVSTLGKKVAPRLPRFFDDVIMCENKPEGWVWSTANPQADLKNRNLAKSPNLPPSFKPLIDKWLSEGGQINVTV